MNMKEKKYIVVTNATRERRRREWPNGVKQGTHFLINIDKYDYHPGGIGLIHPAVVICYKNYDKNSFERPLILDAISYLASPHIYDEKNIPVLMYGQHDYLSKAQYFLALLREGEFRELNGTSLKDFKGQISNDLECILKKKWKYLEAFDLLMEDKIGEIPIEATSLKIDRKDVEIHNREARNHNKKYFELLERQYSPSTH